jgi:hypothetical protein
MNPSAAGRPQQLRGRRAAQEPVEERADVSPLGGEGGWADGADHLSLCLLDRRRARLQPRQQEDEVAEREVLRAEEVDGVARPAQVLPERGDLRLVSDAAR